MFNHLLSSREVHRHQNNVKPIRKFLRTNEQFEWNWHLVRPDSPIDYFQGFELYIQCIKWHLLLLPSILLARYERKYLI